MEACGSARGMHGGHVVTERATVQPEAARRVWIVEDEPAAAALAAELCRGSGMEATVFSAALPFLAALRAETAPEAVVFDWRLEHELSAALFLATRHRHPMLRVVYWTGIPPDLLPSMIRADARTRVVDKAAGAEAFEAAVHWAVAGVDLSEG